MTNGHSLTTHQMFVNTYHSKTNEISFTTHPLDIAYYVRTYVPYNIVIPP
jgi:(p)ppGpp synthase/HD superfamily hydrolase